MKWQYTPAHCFYNFFNMFLFLKTERKKKLNVIYFFILSTLHLFLLPTLIPPPLPTLLHNQYYHDIISNVVTAVTSIAMATTPILPPLMLSPILLPPLFLYMHFAFWDVNALRDKATMWPRGLMAACNFMFYIYI